MLYTEYLNILQFLEVLVNLVIVVDPRFLHRKYKLV